MHNGYTYVRATSRVNHNGSLIWRCAHSRDQYKCKSTCSTLNDQIIRRPGPHACPKLSQADLVFQRAQVDILKEIRQAPESKPRTIFMEKINKAIEKLPQEYTSQAAKALPKWENFVSKAYRAKRAGKRKASNS
jgi:hypothetical protein